MKSSSFILGGTAVACVGAVAFAVASQSLFKMQPCAWCILQRVICLAIAVACVIGLIWRGTRGRVVCSAVTLLLAMSGMAAALWQHFQAASQFSCTRSLAERIIQTLQLEDLWPRVFAIRASCADAVASLLGVPYDFWSLALFAAVAVASIRVMQRAWPEMP